MLANVLFWVDRTLLNSDRFAAAVEETMARPDVQDRFATVISQQAASELDVQARVSARLPDELQFLVPLAGDSVTEELLYRVSLRVLSSDFTADLQGDIVRNLHAQVIATLEDNDDRAVHVQGQSLVLDLRPIIERIFERIGLPVPARLQAAGIEGRGVVVLVDESSGLSAASFFVTNRIAILVVSVLIAIACLAGAVLLSGKGIRGVSRAGFAVAAAGLLTMLILAITNFLIPDERVVLRELLHALEQSLRTESLLLVIVGATMVLGTDAGVRTNFTTARRSIATRLQRVSPSSALLMGIGGLILMLWAF